MSNSPKSGALAPPVAESRSPEHPPAQPRPHGNTHFLPIFLAIAAVIVLIIRLAVILGSELFQDEALYVWLSRMDPFGFTPHPPGVPALVRVGMELLGTTEAGVRLGSFLMAALTPIPVYYLARSIGGRTVALWSALAVVTVPMYGAIGSVATPDAPQLFLWSVALLLTWRALETGRPVLWSAVGVVLGVGLFIKYIIVLYFPSLLLCLLLSPRWRRHLRTPGPYLMTAVAFLVFAPGFIWSQSAAGWTTFQYHLGDRQELILPNPESFLTYHGLHAVYISPIFYPLALAAMVWAGVQGYRRRDDRLLFLFSFSAVTWLFFASIALVTKRELSREQWDATAYIPALIAVALLIQARGGLGQWDTETDESRHNLDRDLSPVTIRRWSRMAIAGPALGLFIFAVVMIEGLTGRVAAQFNTAPLYGNFKGWSTMAESVDHALAQLPPGTSPAFILGNTFVESQEYDFYSGLTPPPRVYSLDSHAAHRYGVTPLLVDKKVNQGSLKYETPGTHAVFVTVSAVEGREFKSYQRRRDKLERLFERVEAVPIVDVMQQGRAIRRIGIYKCFGLLPESQWDSGAKDDES